MALLHLSEATAQEEHTMLALISRVGVFAGLVQAVARDGKVCAAGMCALRGSGQVFCSMQQSQTCALQLGSCHVHGVRLTPQDP